MTRVPHDPSNAGLRTLVTGCGRSGTNYLCSLLRAAGRECGHEEVFDVWGWTGSPLHTESSWYAVPFMTDLPKLERVLHVVRAPEGVIRSFHRIGMLADSGVHHASRGRPVRFALRALSAPRKAAERIAYVRAHRAFFRDHAPDILEARDEVARLERYWLRWNERIEAACADRAYLRVRLEDVNDRLPEIARFLELSRVPEALPASNTKPGYERLAPAPFGLGPETVALARRYGYEPR